MRPVPSGAAARRTVVSGARTVNCRRAGFRARGATPTILHHDTPSREPPAMQLHAFHLSGHSHRVRLFLSLLGLAYEEVEVDMRSGAHHAPAHLALNPFGQLPVLVDGADVVCDSTAILVYLARKYAPAGWLPEAPADLAAVQRWLSVASGELANGPAVARGIHLWQRPMDAAPFVAKAHGLLARLEAHLAGREWLATGRPTVADVALYAYVESAPEGGVDLAAYPSVRRWLERIEALPGFVPFPRSPIGLRAA
jgi:glutathione S-transferase